MQEQATQPKVSIITVCYNSVDTMERTMRSVLHQTYSNIEYIIVDGGSTDGTIGIINKFNDTRINWSSEQDNGIYDAMNKGVNRATGEWIYFIGSDDYLLDEGVISRLFSDSSINQHDAVYGIVLMQSEKSRYAFREGGKFSINKFKKGWMPSHQGIFIRRELILNEGGFDLQYHLAADFDLLCKIFRKTNRVSYWETAICCYSMDGASSNELHTAKERATVICREFGQIWSIWYLTLFVIKYYLRLFLKSVDLLKYWYFLRQSTGEGSQRLR